MNPTNYQITNNRVQRSREASLMILGQLLDGNHLEPREWMDAEILIETLTAELKRRMGIWE